MQQLTSAIGSAAAATSDQLAELLKLSGDLDFSADSMVTTAGLRLSDLIARAEAILAVASPISEASSDNLALAPTGQLKGFGDAVSNMSTSIGALHQQLSSLIAWGGINRVDGNGTVFAPNNQQVPLRSLLDNFAAHEDNALANYTPIAVAMKPRGTGSFVAAARNLQDTAAGFERQLAAAEKSLLEINTKLEGAAASAEAAATNQTEVERSLEEAEKGRKAIDEYQSEAAAAKELIEAVQQEATTLRSSVREYQEDFASFDAALEKREEALKIGNKKLQELQVKLDAKDAQASQLIEKSKEMLGGATIAGLSSAYNERAIKVDDQLRWARVSYYGAIAFLVVSVLVALNLFSLFGLVRALPALPTVTRDLSAGAAALQILAGLGSRLLIILPALLLAGFTAHRHAMLFRLREEYSHKYALAASVHGFKQQAPQFEEAIAAAVFQELLHNPAGSMDEKEARKENGFLARIIRPQVDAALERMRLIDKSGGA